MFQLTREVRFSLDSQFLNGENGYGGIPSVTALGPFLTLRVSLAGSLEPQSNYLRNIVDIDREVRSIAIPHIVRRHRQGATALAVVSELPLLLTNAWPGSSLVALDLNVSPFQTAGIRSAEPDMVRLSQMFEFSAAHRLHNPALSDDQNVQIFGKCNNPLGHGHNYQVQVTIAGTLDANGQLRPQDELEHIVKTHAIDPLDHKHLNLQVPIFSNLNPSVENIAKVIYDALKIPLQHATSRLTSVTVWETPKTFCEYSED